VDDLRESPAVEIAMDLARAGQEQILIADPNLSSLPTELAALSNVSFCDTLEAVRHADIVALLVAHSRFRKIPREELMRRVVIDVTGLTHASARPPPQLTGPTPLPSPATNHARAVGEQRALGSRT